MMTGTRVVGVVVALLGAASAVAAQGGKWIPPRCDLKPGHFMVNSGVLYLKSATETQHDAQRTKDLRDAHRVLTEAIKSHGQDKNGAAWYYLARYYGLTSELQGADSAFRRAEAIAPACKGDIDVWRRQLWTPIFNQGVNAFNAGKTDSALHYFREAGAIYPEPIGLSALASLMANGGQTDSALKYYGQAAEAAGTDTQYTKERREALYNRGAVLYQTQRWKEARDAFQDYLSTYPGDVQALAALASAHVMDNQGDSAVAIYQQILQSADSADPGTLFSAGAAMFNSAGTAPDTTAKAAECRKAAKTPADRRRCGDEAKALMRQHDSSASGAYQMAARAFESGLKRAPYSRDGLYNLTSTYYLMQDSAKMLPTAQRLYSVDPLNRNGIRLLAAAFQMRGKTDSTVHYISLAESTLVADVTVGSFRPSDQGATIEALVTNFHTKPSAPFKLVFEFMKADGTVAATQTADVPQLPAQGTHQVNVQVTGQGIVAWRYKKG